VQRHEGDRVVNGLFYISADGQLTAVPVKPGAGTFEIGIPERLFDYAGVGDDFTYDVTPDDERFLVNTLVSDASQPIVVVLNWSSELKK
jgi:hypothetical protein